MKLIVEIKKSYGKEYIYGVCEQSMKLLDLLDTKTFSPRALGKLKLLGYIFEVKAITL